MVTPITDTEKEKIINSPAAIIKYYADWCGSCRLFAPIFKRNSNDEKYESIDFFEVDAETNPELRKLGGVTNLPFFATLKNGIVQEAGSFSKEERLVEMLEKILT
ncbi:MAG: thioredoxin family protein [Bacteroidetes bacterium]|nr:thioredoxin family protein [Bacteroidota bacterium]